MTKAKSDKALADYLESDFGGTPTPYNPEGWHVPQIMIEILSDWMDAHRPNWRAHK